MPPRRTHPEGRPRGMLVGCLRLRVAIRGAASLKEKRMVIKSVKDRLAHRFNASVAEVGDLDLLQVGVLGVAMAGNDEAYLEGALSKMVDFVRFSQAELLDYRIEVFPWDGA